MKYAVVLNISETPKRLSISGTCVSQNMVTTNVEYGFNLEAPAGPRIAKFGDSIEGRISFTIDDLVRKTRTKT